MLLPVVMLPINIILGTQEKKYKGLYCFLIAFGLAAIAYNFRPFYSQNTDILRHWVNMQNATQLTLSDIDGHRVFSGLPGYFLLLKFFSYARSEFFLQTMSTLFGYFICLSVIRNADDNSNKKISFVTVFLFLSCISFLGFCSGIRQYLVFSLFLLFFYLETFKGKYRYFSWIVYISIITLHTSAVILLVFRLSCEFFKHPKRLIPISVILLIWTYVQDTLVSFLENNFAGIAVIDKIIELSGFYEDNPSPIIIPVFVWRFAALIFCTFVTLSLLNKHNDNSRIPLKYIILAYTSCLFAFGGVVSYDVFARFSIFSIMITTPLIPEFFKILNKKTKELLWLGLIVFSSMVLYYNITQYMTFNFNDLLDILTTNIITFLGAI